jgi:hypothetical protein
MPKFPFSFDGVPGWGEFTPIPPGVYRAIVTLTEGNSKSSGNYMITAQYMIVDDGEYYGRFVWDYMSFPGLVWENGEIRQVGDVDPRCTGARKWKALCAAVGMDVNSDVDDIDDAELLIKVGIRDDNGERNTIDGLFPIKEETPSLLMQCPECGEHIPIAEMEAHSAMHNVPVTETTETKRRRK